MGGGGRCCVRRAWRSHGKLKAISWSLILICHSAVLNTCRQIPADTRGRGDRKQLGSFFYENLQTILRAEKKTLESKTLSAAAKGNLSELVHALGTVREGKLTLKLKCLFAEVCKINQVCFYRPLQKNQRSLC